MTNRERFRAVALDSADIDRCPVIEWASWWDKTILEWEKEGLPKGMSSRELFEYFNLDPHIQYWFPHRGAHCPEKAAHGAPLILDEDDYKSIKKFLYPKEAVDWMLEKNAVQSEGDNITWYTLEGFFWFPRELFGIENHLYSFYDKQELYRRICEDLLAWQITVIDEFAKNIKADFMTIAEDMSYNHGSMISEETFETFIAPYYRRLIPEIKKHGTLVLIDSDGDISKSVPWYLRSGADGILPLERQSGVDIAELQILFPEFIWLGGFDKMCLFKDVSDIDAEFDRIRPALRKGRYIPSVDHQTPPGVSLENYRYYVNKLRQWSTQACKDAQ